MYIVTCGNECGVGETIEEAVNNLENQGYSYNVEYSDFTVYKSNKVKVKRKFEIVEEY